MPEFIIYPAGDLPVEALREMYRALPAAEMQLPIVWRRPDRCNGKDGADLCAQRRELRAAQLGSTLGYIQVGHCSLRNGGADGLVIGMYIADDSIAAGIASGRLSVTPEIAREMQFPPNPEVYHWMLMGLAVQENETPDRIEVGDPRAKRITEGLKRGSGGVGFKKDQ